MWKCVCGGEEEGEGEGQEEKKGNETKIFYINRNETIDSTS